jgi:hypothetical protein
MSRVYSVDNDNDNFSMDVRNVLHSVKYNGKLAEKIDEDCVYGESNFDSLSREEQERLGRLAIYVAVSFQERKLEVPKWAMSGRIYLDPPLIDKYCAKNDIKSAHQASKTHNVFVPLVSFDVM